VSHTIFEKHCRFGGPVFQLGANAALDW